MMAVPLTDISEEVMESTFINGLKPDIKAEVRLWGQIMETAQKVEHKNAILQKFKEPTTQRNYEIHPNPAKPDSFPMRTVTIGQRVASQRREAPIKRMSNAEWKMREKNLCFRCEKRYTVGDQCKNRELQVLLVQRGEEDEVVDEFLEEEPLLEVGDKVELSPNSVVGMTTPGTMKLKGTVQSNDVVVLIDCGVTHNFISQEVIQRLGLPTIATNNYRIIMGTGESMTRKGICKGAVLKMQRLTIVEDFLPLELGSTDIVLGMQWLGSLGSM